MVESRSIIKFADESVIRSLLWDHKVSYGPVMENVIKWCEDSYLQHNASKTKEMLIDFCRNPSATAPTLIKGIAVE